MIPLGIAVLSYAQQPPAAAAGRLKVNIVAGQGAVNNIVVGVAAQPIVEVLDEKDAPVAGADVTFEAPADGPSGTFFGKRTQSVKTDAKGRALGTGFAPNSLQGRFQMSVKAASGTAMGENTISQTNGGPGLTNNGAVGPPNRKKLWTILAIATGAAVGGGVAASRNGGSTTTAAGKRPVTIGAGAITVGGPR